MSNLPDDLTAFMIAPTATVRQAMEQLSQAGSKRLLVVVDEENKVLGVLNDGDVRRHLLARGRLADSITEIYNRSPHLCRYPPSPANLRKLLTKNRVISMPEVDQANKLIAIHCFEDEVASCLQPQKKLEEVTVAVLAGGFGKRLDPFTRILPKALIPIHQKPVIEHILESFGAAGIEQFELILHHQAELIQAYFRALAGFPYALSYHIEPHPLGTAGGLSLLDPNKVERDIFLSNCDIMISADYRQILDFHRDGDFPLTVVGAARQITIPYGVLRLQNNGGLDRLDEKPQMDLLVNTGMYILRREVLPLLQPDQRMDATDVIDRLLKQRKKIGVFPIGENDWQDVGQWPEYQKAQSHPF
jgi:dTDP-glucose pyrophosphorylase